MEWGLYERNRGIEQETTGNAIERMYEGRTMSEYDDLELIRNDNGQKGGKGSELESVFVMLNFRVISGGCALVTRLSRNEEHPLACSWQSTTFYYLTFYELRDVCIEVDNRLMVDDGVDGGEVVAESKWACLDASFMLVLRLFSGGNETTS